MTRQPKGRIMCSTHEWLDEKPCPYCNNPSASHDSGRTTAMTRQQEGDEAMKQKWYEERAQEIIRQEDMVSLTEALTVQDAACAALARKALMAREPLATEAIDWLDSITRPATVQPEDEPKENPPDARNPSQDQRRGGCAESSIQEEESREIYVRSSSGTSPERIAELKALFAEKIDSKYHPEDDTTLPAMDVKCACEGTIEAVRSVHSPDECVNMDHYVLRISAEAERDALKAEVEKSADEYAKAFQANVELHDHLQAQLDAVVGQETAYRKVLEAVRDDSSGRDHLRHCRTDVYYPGLTAPQDDRCSVCEKIDTLLDTPPLKAGQ